MQRVLPTIAFLLAFASTLTFADNLSWFSGFENGFPSAEWLEYEDGAYSAIGVLTAKRSSAWTIVDIRSGEPVFSGRRAYKGWIAQANASSHRAYPVVHVDIATPLINSFMVYVDVDYARMGSAWLSLATWGNYDPLSQTGQWALHTMSIRERKIEFAHVSPFHGVYIGTRPQPEFPLRRWVRITVYIQYAGKNGVVQAWQDGVPMLWAQVSALERFPGTRLRTAHWGLYASGDLDQGIQYNDDIAICVLDAPLTNLIDEPRCPAAIYP